MPEDFRFDISPSDPSKVTGAFGFSADQGTSQAIQTSLDNAQGIADMMKGNVNTKMIEAVAGSAAAADSLTIPISTHIQTTLGNAAQTLGMMQSPIEQGIVTQLSSIGGNATTLGVNLPTGTCPPEQPTCVAIATEAAAGKLDTALCFARGYILPNCNPKTPQYYTYYNFVSGCLAAYPQLWNQFLAALSSMQCDVNLQIAPGATQVFSPLPAVGSGSPPQPSSSGQFVQPVSSQPPKGILVPETVATFNPLPGVGTAPPPQIGLVNNPSNLIPGQIPGSGPPPSLTASPATGVIAGSGAPPAGSIYQGVPTPGVIQQPNAGPNGETLCTNQYGAQWLIPPGQVCGSGPPPTDYTGVVSPGIPSQPSVPPGSTFRPEVPSQPKPPPQQQQPCIKICPPDKPDCPDKQYCVWQDGDTRVCYVLPSDQPPRRPFDKKLICGVPSDSWLSAVMNQCGQQQQPQQPQQPPSEAMPGVNQLNGCGNLFRFQALAQPLTGDFFTQLIAGVIDSLPPFQGSGLAWADSIVNAFRESSGEIVGSVFDAIARMVVVPPFNCSGTAAENGIIGARILTGLAARWLSSAAEPADTSLAYAQNSLCPYRLPSPGEATSSWLANNIDLDRLRCIVEANGNLWDSWLPIADAARSKLSIGEYATLLRRQFMTQNQYEQKVREAGLTRDDDKFLAYQLTEYIPNPSDITSLMIRDAADTVNIDWSKSDAIFADKYVSPLSDWGDKQGVTREFMRMLWRAHWSLPAPGQLYEMLHRLSRLPADNPAYVDLARIRQTLLQQDIHPDWVDSFIAVSYNPLTRIDATRAYRIGALDQDGLKEAYLNLGYDSGTADTLVNFNVLNTRQTILRRPELRQYANGEITANDMYDSLRTFGARDEDLPIALQRAQSMLSIGRRKRCVAAIRKRYLLAEMSLVDVQTELQQQGLDNEQVGEISAGMQCERNARGKVLNGSAILSLYRDGVITEADAFNRLMTIGYDEDEASLLVRQAAQRIQLKLAADQLKQLKQQQRDAAKLKAAIDKQNRQAATQQKQLAANAQRAQAKKEQREKRLLEAAKLVAQHTGMEYSDAVFFVKNVHLANITTTASSIDESINAIGVAASDKDLTTTDEITSAVAVSIAALV